MARPTYSDILMSFTIGASTNPTSTQAASLIVELFKQAFTERNEVYSTDTDTVMDSEEAYAIIKSEAARLLTQWANSLRRDSQIQMPVLYLSKEAVAKVKQLTKQKDSSTKPIIGTMRLWGNSDNWTGNT